MAMPPDNPRSNPAAALAAVADRAMHLFADGYRAERLDDYAVEVTSPAGDTYEIDTLFGSCTCPYFEYAQGRHACKHLLGYEELLDAQERHRQLRLREAGEAP